MHMGMPLINLIEIDILKRFIDTHTVYTQYAHSTMCSVRQLFGLKL